MQQPSNEDNEMLDALDMMSIDRKAGEWLIGIGSSQNKEIIDRLRDAWKNLKLYGKASGILHAPALRLTHV